MFEDGKIHAKVGAGIVGASVSLNLFEIITILTGGN